MPSIKRSPIALSLLAAGLAMASLAGLVAAPTSSQAGWTPPSFLDTTFNPDANGGVNRVLVQSDGKILIGGTFTGVGGETRGRVARLNADGTVDNTFANPAVNGAVRSMALQTDGKILIGGEFTEVGGATRNKIARLNINGTLDTSFDIGAITGVFGGQPIVHAIAVQSDGKIMVGGTFGSFRYPDPSGPQIIRFASARLNTDGTVDTSYASPLASSDRAWTVEVLSSGKILLGTQSSTAADRLVLANTDGTRDSAFVNPNPNMDVFDTAVQADGKILVGGSFTTIAGETRNRLARLNADGSLDTGFNPNLNGPVESISLRADGKILVGGRFTSIGVDTRTRVAILNADGTVDTAFFPTVNGDVYSAVSQADGNILIGGFFTTVEGQTRNRVARVFPELDPAAPASTSPPTISGTAEVGQTLTVDDVGDWTGYREPEFTYQWQRCEQGTPTVAGVDWTSRTPIPSELTYWRSVAWGGPAGQEKFVAVSLSTTYPVMTSPDGVTWTAPPTTGVNGGWSVAWGGPAGQKKFVAVSNQGTGNRVMTSPDGVTWTAQTSASNQFWRSVAWGGPAGNEKFVAVAQSANANHIMTSPDGIDWDLQTSPDTSLGWKSVTWGDPPGTAPGQFVAVAVNGVNNQVMTSENGVTWVTRTTPGTGSLVWDSVTWGGPAGQEKFVAVAAGGPAGDDLVMTSPDGVTWTGRATSDDGSTAVAWGGPAGGEKFVAIGGTVITSPDGINWTDGTAAEGGLWGGLTWGGPTGARKFVAVGGIFENSAVRGTVMTSETSDGLTCTDISGATGSTYTLAGADEGKKIRVKVTGTNSEGSASANSAPTANVAPQPPAPPANTASPTISGEAKVGEKLTASPGTWSGNPAPTFTYQWQRCDASGSNCVNISGATTNEYTLTGDDEGSRIRVVVTATNSQGTQTANSEPTALIPVPGPGPDPGPTPSGKPKLKLSVKTPKKVKAGKGFRITARTSNVARATTARTASTRSGTTATTVKTCVKLPKGLFVARSAKGKVSGRTICWTRSSLAAGKSVTYKPTVRSSKTKSGSMKVTGTARASGSSSAPVKASGSSKVRMVEPKKPKPKPPTG